MDDRWLRSVDDLLMQEARCSQGPYDEAGYDDPSDDSHALPAGDPRRGTLTQVVLLEGRVIDVTHPPIQGSGYECAALELAHLRPTPPPRVERVVVREPPHEAMLGWLQRVVGGEAALAELDAQPLPVSSPIDAGSLPDQERELVQAIDEQLERASVGWFVADEVLSACRGLLRAAVSAGMLRVWRDVEPERIAAILVHCIAKANGLVGSGAPFTVAHWLRDLGTTTAPSSRSGTLATTIGGGQWSHGQRPREAPDVYVLGDSRLLVSRFRRELMTYRDLADSIREE